MLFLTTCKGVLKKRWEYNLDVLKCCDHLIDLGPEGGDKGGAVLGFGTPEDICKIPNSYTGKFLKKLL